MIRFACTCSFVLEVPTELAGTPMQCPNCGHLVDIPPLSELGAIDEDGTYKMDDVQVEDEPYRLSEQIAAFTQERVDQFGREKDLRPTQDDFAGLDVPEELDLADEPPPEPQRIAPKYDPVTGELIRPLDVKEHKSPVNPQAIPAVDAQMSRIKSVLPPFQPRQIIPSLFKFTNLVVMLVILIGHIFQQFVFFVALAGIWMLVPAAFILTMLFFSHYAVIIDDIGREERDELPRPLRDLSWHDDLWGPFVQFFGSLLLCYGLAFGVLWMPLIPGLAWVATVLIAGTLIFPAVFLTLTTSGSIVNLTPDRLMRVMSSMGVSYLIACMLWPLAALVYVAGIAGTMVWLASTFVSPDMLPPRNTIEGFFTSPPPWLVYPVLLLGIVLMHGFCWYLALQYRAHHESFGWAFQRHDGAGAGGSHGRRGFSVMPAVDTPEARRARMKGQRVQPAQPAQPVPQRALPVPPSQQQ